MTQDNKTSVLDYINRNKSDLYAICIDGLTNRQKSDGAKVTNVLIFQKSWIEKHFDVFCDNFLEIHRGQPKTTRTKFLSLCNGLKWALDDLKHGKIDGVTWYQMPVAYADIPKSEKAGGTRAHSVEKTICKHLGYKWIGGLRYSAQFTIERVANENATRGYDEFTIALDHSESVVPDGYKVLSDGSKIFLECKAICGRMIKS